MTTERHPLAPFIPKGAKILLLGSFPPKKERWSMDFFYPNFQNDMWKIMGWIFHSDKEYFIADGPDGEKQKRYDKVKCENFCTEKGIAMYDTASKVRRLKDNASDKFLEVVQATDLPGLLSEIPDCRAIVTTGQKATDVIVGTFGCEEPPVGEMRELELPITQGGNVLENKKILHFWRMPSSSRAYPLALEKKAAFYRMMYEKEGLL